jgi:hypothetical protein
MSANSRSLQSARIREVRCAASFARLVAVTGLSIALGSGCYHARVSANERPIGRDPSSLGQSETLWSIAWGLSQQNLDTSGSCGPDAIQSVTSHSNGAFNLLTVVTLGFVSAVTVTWRCAKPETTVIDGAQPDDPL